MGGAVLHPVLKRIGDFPQGPPGDPFSLPVGVKKTEYPLGLLEGLDQAIETCQRMPLELGRGCPFACKFCSTNDFFRRNFRLKSPGQVIAQMRALHRLYGHTSFELIHDMFTVNRKRVVAFCEAMVASGEKFQWYCSARTDSVDDE